ncbi:probable inactive shikimate kinase like 2, chloroplastic isoform X1 [Rhodamnia argentea]|uniref:Probable inactive shikimate kinase like 2, chloroplastic isoform X1 n=1 Tax=Rhodamnia argentea TaxID=178133 RepID=A0A8B8PHJ9_9MYRT|nr:probable inactive shikimate kinase like 2, chloroplastic isoform X1 [Rhodamnia argentea]
MATATPASCFFNQRTFKLPSPSRSSLPVRQFATRNAVAFKTRSRVSCSSSLSPATPISYEFSDGSSDMELRLQLGGIDISGPRDIYVDANDTSLTIQLKHSGSHMTLMETDSLFDRIKSDETIWYLDDDQLVINLKKQNPELKWPDIVESWESLAAGSMQLLRGTSIYIIGDSMEINQKVAKELAVGLGYTPLETKELLETFAKQTIDSWVLAEGYDAIAEAEGVLLESLSSHVRAVVATLGGQQGAARRADKWQHLYAGFTVWLSATEATVQSGKDVANVHFPDSSYDVIQNHFNAAGSLTEPERDEDSATKEVRRHIEDGSLGYANADVVVKLQGWDASYSKTVAQASLSALKRLVLSDRKLPDKKSLYIRLGCRGDWPNIKPPGWDPSTADDSITSPDTL